MTVRVYWRSLNEIYCEIEWNFDTLYGCYPFAHILPFFITPLRALTIKNFMIVDNFQTTFTTSRLKIIDICKSMTQKHKCEHENSRIN